MSNLTVNPGHHYLRLPSLGGAKRDFLDLSSVPYVWKVWRYGGCSTSAFRDDRHRPFGWIRFAALNVDACRVFNKTTNRMPAGTLGLIGCRVARQKPGTT